MRLGAQEGQRATESAGGLAGGVPELQGHECHWAREGTPGPRAKRPVREGPRPRLDF